jgi:hypothetical protein
MKLSLELVVSSVERSWKNMHWSCGLEDCQNKLFLRSVPQSRVGIRMGETWYCSVDCFVKATRHRFTVLTSGRSLDMPHIPRVSIASVMLSKGYLTEAELRAAQDQSRLSGEELEALLIHMELVDEWHLASARAIQWGYPVLGRDRISQPVDADLPLTLMKGFSAVPLHYSKSAKRLVMGFVCRVQHSLLHSLEQVTDCKAEPCFITPTELHYQTERLEAACVSREVVLEDSMTPTEMANVVGGLALEIRVKDVKLTRCQDYVWMRLMGKQQMIDVLFRGRRAKVARKCDTFPASARGIQAAG